MKKLKQQLNLIPSVVSAVKRQSSNSNLSVDSAFNTSKSADSRSTDSAETDDFEDAVDQQPQWRGCSSVDSTLYDNLCESHVAQKMFFNNHFDEARARMQPLAGESMYHALGYSTIIFIRAVMTCDREDIAFAAKVTQDACSVCDRFRCKQNLTQRIVTMGYINNQNRIMTDEEMHAELCFAECLLLHALITFVQDENFSGFVKGSLKIRSCYNAYRECQRILETHQWSDAHDPKLRAHFESGTRTGLGVFNLMLSTLPGRILKVLEVVGFSGNKQIGLYQLETGAFMNGTLRQPLCTLALLTWHLVTTFTMGMGETDVQLCKKLLVPMLADYPKGALTLFFLARFDIVTAQLPQAVQHFGDSIRAQDQWTQFHHVCYWELMFAHGFQRQWGKCYEYAKILYNESKWSRATYAYLSAVFLHAQYAKLGVADRGFMEDLFGKVPSLKMRIAGKSIPIEKYCALKASRFTSSRTAILAHYEFLYFWNGFQVLGQDEGLVQPILAEIDRVSEIVDKRPVPDPDDVCLCLFLKAMCLRNFQSPFQAEECLVKIVESESSLKDHFYLVPNAYFELALLCMDRDSDNEALNHLTKVKSYKGYTLELRMQYRVHSAMEQLGAKTPV